MTDTVPLNSTYDSMGVGKLQDLRIFLETEMRAIRAQGLNLDITRGKPGKKQLDLSSSLDGILEGSFTLEDGSDARNYGGLPGIMEARKLGGAILGVGPEKVLAGGNSSLTLMHFYAQGSHFYGLGAEKGGWWQEAQKAGGKIKFLCPSPGYDRHFTVCESLHIEMLPIPMDDNGPDMDAVEAAVKSDPLIKGIWCVPRFSNPTGIVYSEEVVKRFSRLGKIAGPGFRIFWDNAYAVHEFRDDCPNVPCLLTLAEEQGTEDSVVMFASTSKMTFAGAGVSWVASSEANLKRLQDCMKPLIIGPDKVNQLRHVRFFPNLAAVKEHMSRHAGLLCSRFDLVESKLHSGLGHLGIAKWSKPDGGYFVSFDSRPGLATQIVAKAAELGVKLTPAGSTWPYGRDPEDTNIRIAPTFPSIEDLDLAMDVFVLCVRYVTLEAELAAK